MISITFSCFPPECGDNSTSYQVLIGEFVLQPLNNTGVEPNEGFVGRLPSFTQAMPDSPISIISQYSVLTSSVEIDLVLPGSITSVEPQRGQYGTLVVITGTRLLGVGEGIALSDVLFGENQVLSVLGTPTENTITVRANSGVPGNVTITINSLQNIIIFGLTTSFEGPFTELVNGWIQLEDGVVSNIVPPAAQAGSIVYLCGERLFGSGMNISKVLLAGISSGNFSSEFLIEPPGSVAATECIYAIAPEPDGPLPLSGPVSISADTLAEVNSSSGNDFSFAEIAAIQPNRGQIGTMVTITGFELLSGYNSTPRVFLSGVEASVINFSESIIETRTQTPPVNSSNITGAVEIVVNQFSLNFSVRLENAWTYDVPGEILSVDPAFGQYGTHINVSGNNLLGYGSTLSEAFINGLSAEIVSVASDSLVTLMAPRTSVTGFVAIELVSDLGSQIKREDIFEYRQMGVISTATPLQGQQGTFGKLLFVNHIQESVKALAGYLPYAHFLQ